MEKNTTKTTLVERICGLIRRDIITNQLKPGKKINIRELCDRYEASETPVRLALTRLISENIIEYQPRQGMRVKTLNINTCEETFDLRQMLECYYIPNIILTLSANKTLQEAFQQNVQSNLEIAQKLTNDSPLDDYLKNYEYDIQFHYLLVRSSGNKTLVDLYQSLNPFQYTNYVYQKQSLERILTGIYEHQTILRAMLDGNEEQAIQAVKDHLTNSKRVIISILKIEHIL